MVERADAGLFGELAEQSAPAGVGAAAPRLRQPERRQVTLRPVSLDELVAEDHRVRQVWAFAERLDLSAWYRAIKAVEGQPGHPPADPRLLLALWLYATVEGVGSARALARLCAEHHAYRWLCGGVSVNHKTLADFRVTHGSLLDGLLTDSFAAMIEAGMASLERVARRWGAGARRRRGGSFRRQSRLLELRRGGRARCRAARASSTDPAAASRGRRWRASGRPASERADRGGVGGDRPAPDQGRCARLDHGCRRPGDEDGRRRLPAGLQPQLASDTKSGMIAAVSLDNGGSDMATWRRWWTRWRPRTATYRASTWPTAAMPAWPTSRPWTLADDRLRPCPSPRRGPRPIGRAPTTARRSPPCASAWPAPSAHLQEAGSDGECANAQARNRGLRQFPVRGLAKVTAIALWFALAQHDAHLALTGGVDRVL